jgi:hypothetical protein
MESTASPTSPTYSQTLASCGHPGLRQELRKVTVEICHICGQGDVVGEYELLRQRASEEKSAKRKDRLGRGRRAAGMAYVLDSSQRTSHCT